MGGFEIILRPPKHQIWPPHLLDQLRRLRSKIDSAALNKNIFREPLWKAQFFAFCLFFIESLLTFLVLVGECGRKEWDTGEEKMLNDEIFLESLAQSCEFNYRNDFWPPPTEERKTRNCNFESKQTSFLFWGFDRFQVNSWQIPLCRGRMRR